MKNIKLYLFSLCGILLLSAGGCANYHYPPAVYVPEPSMLGEAPLVDDLLVEKIKNAQPEKETLRFAPNNDPWILMPLCFYSSERVNPMVKRNYLQNDLDDALQRLFIKDIRASGITKNTINACKINTTAKELNRNYRLELVLKHAVWKRNITAYGLSYPGTLLWSIGLPVSYGSVLLEIDAAIYAPNSNLKPIAKTTIKHEQDCVEFIYDQIGYKPSVSENILADIFPLAAKDLRKFIRTTLKEQKK